MAAVKSISIVEQNANTIAGAQVTSATFVGTNIAADLTIRVGRDAALISMVGTQTASTGFISLETINAYHGAQVVFNNDCLAASTAVLSFFSGPPGTGYAVSTQIRQGTCAIAGSPLSQTFVLNGTTQKWQ